MAKISKQKTVFLLLGSKIAGISDLPGLQQWLAHMPELSILAKVEPVVIFGKDSASTTPEVWSSLSKVIADRHASDAGFVVLHAPDTLLYTSAAVAFCLQTLSVPVIFSGSHSQADAMSQAGLKSNIINAVQAATFPFGEVTIMFGNRLVRAVQAYPEPGETLNAFNAPRSGVLGKIDFSIRLHDKLLRSSAGKPKPCAGFEKEIAIVYLQPLVTTKQLQQLAVGKKALLLNAQDWSQLPQSVENFIHAAPEVPVVIWSQQMKMGSVLPKNVVLVQAMSWPTTQIKLMWALPQTRTIRQLRDVMERDVLGEIIS